MSYLPLASACVPYFPNRFPSTTHNFCSLLVRAQRTTSKASHAATAPCTILASVGTRWKCLPTIDSPVTSARLTQSATQCLIHATAAGLGVGQDALDVIDFLTNNDPIQIQAGSYSQSKLGVGADAPISTSDSIITLPILPNSRRHYLRSSGFFKSL